MTRGTILTFAKLSYNCTRNPSECKLKVLRNQTLHLQIQTKKIIQDTPLSAS